MRRSIAFTFALLATAGCLDDDDDVIFTDEIAAEEDCDDACGDWEDCTGEAFDVPACEERCEEAVADRRLFASDVDDCEDCLDRADGRCVEDCLDVCAAVVLP